MIIKQDPKALLLHQISHLYVGEISEEEKICIDQQYEAVKARLDLCFSHVKNKYYHNNGETIFNPLHVAQWTMFLYTISNQIKRNAPHLTDLCDKIYGLSKCFSSADLYYEVELPDVWFFDHPQGSVMGRAEYSNFFTFSQGCTVGNNKGLYPRFGEHVAMMSSSKVLGNCSVGHHVIFAANSYIIDRDIPPYSIVFGENPNVIVHSITPEKFQELTASMFDCDDAE